MSKFRFKNESIKKKKKEEVFLILENWDIFQTNL